LRSELYHMNNVAGVLLKNEVHSDWQTLMAFYYAFIGIMLIFAIGMTFAVLFNAMTVNVLERQRELATMRSIGTGCGLITSMILVENIFLWLLTLAPGLLAGYWGALQMGNAFKTDLFVFQMVIYPSSYILTSLGILLTMLLATLPTIRRVNRLNLAEATKVLT
jgi:putative ABC transport system permease protein